MTAELIQEPVTLHEVDGFLVDDAGEIHGHAQCAAEFHVTDQVSAEWVLAKMMDADATMAGLNAKKRAIFDNIELDVLHHAHRKAFFEARFASELAAFARANLRKNSKTWRCACGSVAFRDGKDGLEITDEAAAIAWVKSLGLAQTIKTTEKLLLSECKEAILKDPPPPGHGIEVKAARESVTIKSGVE